MTELFRAAANPSDPLRDRPVGRARGTRDWPPGDYRGLYALECALMDEFMSAGFEPIRTPILEVAELHSRKSGAGVVSRLYQVSDEGSAALCLRPELTAGIVRAYVEAPQPPAAPWRVCASGAVFRHEPDPAGARLREFTQTGVEILGAAGPWADAEAIALACTSLKRLGLREIAPRIGHVGLILEILSRAGLPGSAATAVVEMLSAAAADGKGVQALDAALERLAEWLKAGLAAEEIVPAVAQADDQGVDRLFRQLVPRVVGRRSGPEIIHRLREKWRLDRSLSQVLLQVRDALNVAASLRGPAPAVLRRLETESPDLAPDALASLRLLIDACAERGLDPDRVELDLGFGRGVGFYTQTIFEITARTPAGPIEVCGGGRYDGLAGSLGSDRDGRGVGFAFGLERVYEACRASGAKP